MKKFLTILLFTIIPVFSFGQKTFVTDTLITNVDTTIFIRFFSFGDWSIQFDYSTFDQDDWTLSLGNSNDGTAFDKFDDSRFPYLLDVTTNSYTDETGATRATISTKGYSYSFIYLGIKIDITTAGTDTLAFKYARE